MNYRRFWNIIEPHRAGSYLEIFEADGDCPAPLWPEDSDWLRIEKTRRIECDDPALLEYRNLGGEEAVKTWTAQGWHAICMGTTPGAYLGPRFLKAFETALNSAPIGPFVVTPVERDWCVALATQRPEDVERFRHLGRKDAGAL